MTTKLTFMWPRFFRLLFVIFFVSFFFRRRSRRRSWFWNESTCFNAVFGSCQFITCSAFVVHTIRSCGSRTFTLDNNFSNSNTPTESQFVRNARITLHALLHLIQSNFVGSSSENFLKCFALQSTQFEAPSPKHPSYNICFS